MLGVLCGQFRTLFSSAIPNLTARDPEKRCRTLPPPFPYGSCIGGDPAVAADHFHH
jgi:hypothetical protein